MFRRITLVVVALALVACSNCNSKCKEGITFYVAEVAGALSRGGSEPITICFDGSCKDVTITRDQVGGSIFVPFKGVGNNIDHDLTVTGVGAFKGEYKGKLASYLQDPGGSCSTCALATVKIGANGALTPAIPAPRSTTTTVGVAVPPGAAATTTSGG
jgi:hypothetical protein